MVSRSNVTAEQSGPLSACARGGSAAVTRAAPPAAEPRAQPGASTRQRRPRVRGGAFRARVGAEGRVTRGKGLVTLARGGGQPCGRKRLGRRTTRLQAARHQIRRHDHRICGESGAGREQGKRSAWPHSRQVRASIASKLRGSVLTLQHRCAPPARCRPAVLALHRVPHQLRGFGEAQQHRRVPRGLMYRRRCYTRAQCAAPVRAAAAAPVRAAPLQQQQQAGGARHGGMRSVAGE